jgi:hypothetical protein
MVSASWWMELSTVPMIDAFKFDITSPANFQLNAIPENVGSGNSGANVDIRIRILNSSKDTIGVYNPSALLDAGIDTALNSGTYYVLIDGVGNVNKTEYGSLGYYSMTGMVNAVLPLRQFKLRGNISEGNQILEWSVQSDELVKSFTVESSTDGKNFQSLITLSGTVRTFNYKTLGGSLHYRLKATLESGREYYSNIILLQDKGTGSPIRLLSALITHTIDISSNGNYAYQLADATGRLLSRGTLQKGINHLPVPQDARGVMFLRFTDDQTIRTEKIFRQ